MTKLEFDKLGGVVDEQGQSELSGSNLLNQILQRGLRLRQLGVTANTTVIIFTEDNTKTLLSLLSVWSIGGSAAIINPKSSLYEVKSIQKLILASFIITDEPYRINPDDFPHVRYISSQIQLPDIQNPITSLEIPGTARLILFTSGTTGVPKGVVHSIQGIKERLANNVIFIGENILNKTLCTLPLHFGHGLIGNCLTPLLNGGTVFFLGNDPRNLARMGEIIDRCSISFLSSVPSLWNLITKLSPPPQNNTLRRVHIGSSTLTASLWKKVIDWTSCPVVNTYGMTECANWISGASSEDFHPADGLVGKMWGGRAAVRQADGEIACQGTGDLLVSSPSIMQGYLSAPDRIEPCLEAGWFDTGDIARISKQKVITLIGRKSYQIKKAGIKIFPEEIDILLGKNATVRDVCTFKINDALAGDLIGVAIVPFNTSNFDLPSLQKWVYERIVKEKIPDKWFIVPKIDRNDNGKVERDKIGLSAMENQIGSK